VSSVLSHRSSTVATAESTTRVNTYTLTVATAEDTTTKERKFYGSKTNAPNVRNTY
jgi:hypothetical protein